MLDIMNIDNIKKLNELGARMELLVLDKDNITTSDYQGAIDAILLDAMQYGYKQAK